MEYSLEEIVRLSGFTVDTIRYYQSLRLIPRPQHRGRNAVYSDEHLDRLRVINRASERGLSLKLVKEVLAKETHLGSDDAMLSVVERQLAKPSHTRGEMAKVLGTPEKLLKLVESMGLVDPLEEGADSLRYSDDDLRIARDALKLLRRGFPLTTLLEVAIKHDRATRKTAKAAIALFHGHLCKDKMPSVAEAESRAEVFRELFPVVTSLVAHHFQRVLVDEALKELKRCGAKESVQVARKSIGQAWLSSTQFIPGEGR
jgi:DNA-binding transcriptional MerR regulator